MRIGSRVIEKRSEGRDGGVGRGGADEGGGQRRAGGEDYEVFGGPLAFVLSQ